MDFRAQANRFLDSGQVLHPEYPLVRSFLEGHGVFRICAYFTWELDHVAFQVLHLVVIEAVALQELEGIVPRSGRLELEAVEVFFYCN